MNLHRTLLASLGVASTVLGIVGAIVPGLPGTVFIIAASHLFARSSPALDAWLRQNRWVGPMLQQFVETDGMSRRNKAVALASTWTELGIGWYAVAALGPAVQMLMIAFGTVATGILLFVVRTSRPVTACDREAVAELPDGAGGLLLTRAS